MIELNINGDTHSADVSPDMPLLWVLRDELGMTGTKYGCGIAQCGACTVHIDGVAVRSCQLPVGSLNGANITTIEGLGSPEAMHAIQTAWSETQVCLLYTSPSPRDGLLSRMPSSA